MHMINEKTNKNIPVVCTGVCMLQVKVMDHGPLVFCSFGMHVCLLTMLYVLT